MRVDLRRSAVVTNGFSCLAQIFIMIFVGAKNQREKKLVVFFLPTFMYCSLQREKSRETTVPLCFSAPDERQPKPDDANSRPRSDLGREAPDN